MTRQERVLIELLRRIEDRNHMAHLLQNFIAEYGPLSEEAGTEVRAILRGDNRNVDTL